jgi:AcrR family transcriptional regulator
MKIAEQKLNKKELILEAAKGVFAKYGFAKTTLEDIGKKVGMKKNSLYHYFANKEDIFYEIINQDTKEYFKRMENSFAKEKNGSEKLKRFLLVNSEFRKEKSGFYSIFISEKIELINRISAFYEVYIQKQKKLISSILQDGINSNEFINHNCFQLADDLIDFFIAIEHWEFRNNKISQFDDDFFNEDTRKKMNLLNFIIKGLKTV